MNCLAKIQHRSHYPGIALQVFSMVPVFIYQFTEVLKQAAGKYW
jgi:hypothetical protein